MFGDPHITTLDGANYTFNGLGDFLLLRAWDGNSSFELQGRTAQTGSVPATNFIAFAAQYNSSSLAPITVREGCPGTPVFYPHLPACPSFRDLQLQTDTHEGELRKEGRRTGEQEDTARQESGPRVNLRAWLLHSPYMDS